MQAQRQRDLMMRSRRAMRWLQPGLVVKRWLLTSGIGLVLALLGAAVWADLQPIYWTLWAIQESLGWITRVLPRGITGPLVLVIGIGLLLWGQGRSFGSIQQALARLCLVDELGPCSWDDCSALHHSDCSSNRTNPWLHRRYGSPVCLA